MVANYTAILDKYQSFFYTDQMEMRPLNSRPLSGTSIFVKEEAPFTYPGKVDCHFCVKNKLDSDIVNGQIYLEGVLFTAQKIPPLTELTIYKNANLKSNDNSSELRYLCTVTGDSVAYSTHFETAVKAFLLD